LINSKHLISVEIKLKIFAVIISFYSLRQIKSVKIKINKRMVQPAVVCGSGTLAVAEVDMKTLSTLERKILRKMCGPVAEQEMWRVRTIQELEDLYKDMGIAADIKKNTFKWIGNIVRMDQGRTAKKIFDRKSKGSRRRGRPRLRWLEDVEKDLPDMKVKRWRPQTVNMKEWASVLGRPKLSEGRTAE
jgi:hypothetical protein